MYSSRAVAGLGLFLLASSCGSAPEATPARLVPQSAATAVRLQAVSAVDAAVVWASGLEGTWARTVDGGETWTVGVVAGAEALQFRDVQGVDAETAYLLSSGPGEASRILKTTDGGASWALQHVNPDPEGFWDCFDFWSAERGLLYGDSVGGRLVVLETADGETWRRLPEEALPPAREGEGGFAASGTCLVTVGEELAYIGTGAGVARLLRTRDGGRSFEAFDAPITSATATAGITTLAFWSPESGMAAGGDVAALDDVQLDVVAVTEDGGVTWQPRPPPPFPGPIYGLAFAPGTTPPALVAVGPGGAALTRDLGATWELLTGESTWSVDFGPSGRGWMVGPEGGITKIELAP